MRAALPRDAASTAVRHVRGTAVIATAAAAPAGCASATKPAAPPAGSTFYFRPVVCEIPAYSAATPSSPVGAAGLSDPCNEPSSAHIPSTADDPTAEVIRPPDPKAFGTAADFRFVLGPVDINGSAISTATASPGGVVEAAMAAANAGQLSQQCEYVEPAAQAACRAAVAGQSDPGVSVKLTLGFIAVRGNEALVGTVGQDCEPNQSPACVTNNDPAAVFDDGQSFDAQFVAAEASASSPTHAYSLTPGIEVGGQWYIDIPSS